MVFSSSIFLFIFFPACLFFYFIGKGRYRNIVLLIFSLLFYSWGEPKNILLMLSAMFFNYFFAIGAESRNKRLKNTSLILSIVYNIGLLFVFKYLNFSVDVINEVFNQDLQIITILLPIGISFYTFQNLSYVIDVYKGEVKAQRNFLDLSLYISLFPQLIAGPIVRYKTVAEQINNRESSCSNIYEGIKRFEVGFAKKILIADNISRLVDTVFLNEYPSIYLNWVGAIAYALQIYFDFSGYSDMAIGIGKIFGFQFIENFNYPYVSKSIQEFWRRWHISLSTWFRDYVYIPLGGSRRGNLRTYFNIFIVFALTGAWHGASYNFIVWGMYYALFLIFERALGKRLLEKMPSFVGHLYAIVVILIGWVLFRADTMPQAISYVKGMFVFGTDDLVSFNFIMTREYYALLLIGGICALPHEKIKCFFNQTATRRCLLDILTMLLFVLAICYMVGSGYSPFLYFRF